MTDHNQSGLAFDYRREGFFRSVLDGESIDHHGWLRAVAESQLVGTCRCCGGHLRPQRAEEQGSGRWWYEANCTSCGHTYAAPGGRFLRRSSRHSEMKSGWWDWREAHLREQNSPKNRRESSTKREA